MKMSQEIYCCTYNLPSWSSCSSNVFFWRIHSLSKDAIVYGMQCFYLQPPSVVCSGDSLKGSMYMERNKENHRLMDVQFSFSHMRVQDGTEYASPPRVCRYHIE